MKQFRFLSILATSVVLFASCTALNTGGQDDDFGWQNYPQAEERSIDYHSDYSANQPSNSTELLDERPTYISDYSTYSSVQPEVRYIPVAVPWWSPYSYTYYEPHYYYPGFYVSISFGNYYYPNYSYYYPNRYWHDDWYYWHYRRHYHPYSYGYYWDNYSYYGHRNHGYNNHGNNNNNNSNPNSSGFGGRIFGENRGWNEKNTVKNPTPVSTTPRSDTRTPVNSGSSGNTGTPGNTGTSGGNRNIFDNSGSLSSQPVKPSSPSGKDVVNPNSPSTEKPPVRRNIFDNSGSLSSEPVKPSSPSGKDVVNPNSPSTEKPPVRKNIFDTPNSNTNNTPVKRDSYTPKPTETNRRADTPRPVEAPRRVESPRAVEAPRPVEAPRRE